MGFSHYIALKEKRMRLIIILVSSLLLIQCNNQSTEKMNEASTFYIGTYTNDKSKGIYKYELKKDGSMHSKGLVAETNNPSFLSISSDNQFLVAVNEISRVEDNNGTVELYRITEDSLEFINRSLSGGANPCYVTIDSSGTILVSNYTGGNLGLLRLTEDGELSDLLDVEQHAGKGTTDRQEAPHAHSVWLEPGTKNVISVDLGTNDLWFSKLSADNSKFEEREPGRLAMAEGAGPRHLTFHPNGNWIYVLNELNATVTQVIKTDKELYRLGISETTLPNDFNDFNLCADIHISSDGKHLYASNRGHHSIVIYEVNSENGALKLLGHQSTRGEWPRNFKLSPDEKYLLVANQNSNNITCFSRDIESGLLSFVQEIEAFNPVCITFE